VSGGRARSKDEGAHEGCNLAGAKEGEKVFDFAHDWPYALLNSETCGWLGGKALLFSQYIILGGKTLGQEKFLLVGSLTSPKKNINNIQKTFKKQHSNYF